MHNSWVQNYQWFHSINFDNDNVSSGRFSDTIPPNYTLFGVYDFLKDINVEGMCCLDIGTMDGITAFTLKKLGASDVIATDMAKRETFLKGRDLLGYDIDYKTSVKIDDLPNILTSKKMDLVVNAGILYHVFDPLTSLSICREIIKNNGLLILETQYLFDESCPIMIFNPCDDSPRGNEHANTFWRASKKAIEGMIEVAGFKVLNTKSINGRLTILAQACRPSNINSKYKKIKNIHEVYMHYKHYGERVDYDNLESVEETSQIIWNGKVDNEFIFRSLYKTEMPFQPVWHPHLFVKIKSTLNDSVFWIRTKFARLKS